MQDIRKIGLPKAMRLIMRCAEVYDDFILCGGLTPPFFVFR